jgi:hypothetical protein
MDRHDQPMQPVHTRFRGDERGQLRRGIACGELRTRSGPARYGVGIQSPPPLGVHCAPRRDSWPPP